MTTRDSWSTNLWSVIEDAGETLGLEIGDSDRQGYRTLRSDALMRPIQVIPAASAGRLICAMDLPGPVEAPEAGDDVNGEGSATSLLTIQDDLVLGRIAVIGESVLVLWELDARSREAALVECLTLMLADAATAYRGMEAAPAGSKHDGGSGAATDGASGDERTEQSEETEDWRQEAMTQVESWCHECAPPTWQVSPRESAWRLVRSSGVARDLPPVCDLVLGPQSLRVGTNVWLSGDPSAEVVEVIAGFLLHQNGRLSARLGLQRDGANGGGLVVMERDLALPLVKSNAINEAVRAVAAIYSSCHREIEALCDREVAGWVGLCSSQVRTRSRLRLRLAD